jgi:Na+/proline symporter
VNGLVLGIGVYVAIQLAVGLLVSRRIRSESEYLLAGRSLGYGLAIFTLFATWFGAETCIGAAGATYTSGLSGGRADPFGYTICLALMGFLFAAPLRRSGVLTLGDAFRARFAPSAEKLVLFFLVPASVLWGAAQIRALGQILSVTSQLDFGLTVAIATAVVIVYTGTGGMRADVFTDLVQGIALIAGLLVLLVAMVAHAGGLGPAFAIARTSALGAAAQPAPGGWSSWEAWLVPIIGSITAQELASRALACRTPAIARNATLLSAALYLIVGLIPVMLGLMGRASLPGLDDPERVIPTLASLHLGGTFQILLLGALISAILSTVDSNLLSASSLLSHNLVLRVWRGATEREKVRSARILVVAIGLAAYGLALTGESVYGLVEEASAFGGGGMAVAMAFGLLSRFGGPVSAVSAMVTSMVVQVGGSYVWRIEAPMTVSCLVSAAVYIAVGVWESRRGPRSPGEIPEIRRDRSAAATLT